MRLNFALGSLVSNSLVAGGVFTFGINVRNERDPVSVRRPNRIAGAGRDGSNLFQHTTGYIDRPDLIFSVSGRHESQFLAVRRPSRRSGRVLVISQLPRLSSAERYNINLRCPFVGDSVDVRNCKRHQITLWRDLRITHAPHFQKIVDREPVILPKSERREHKQRYRDGKESLHMTSL